MQVQVKLTQSVVNNTKPSGKLFWVRDMLLKGFVMSVSYGGKKTYCVDYKRGNGKRATYKIGDANLYTVAEAREAAREFLSSVERGEDPSEPEEKITLGNFLKDIYEPWVMENRKTGKDTVTTIRTNFGHLFDTPLEALNVAQIEQWRTKKKKDKDIKASSLNRMATALTSAVNWAVKRGIIEINPFARLETLPERDSVQKVRYLTEDERARLIAALDKREKEIREGRDSHNKWLKARGLETVEPIGDGEFADYLKPIVILSLSTGIRRNSVLSLEWRDVNFADRTVMVRAATSKADKQYYVSLNKLALGTLSAWQKQSKHTAPGSLIFPSPRTGKKMESCVHSWETLLKKADIQDFRWHDMRHDFASQLVMKGIDLNTVRELLGHADLKMTLRYAHLAPENKLRAVEMLD
ncbi:recombinase [Synergistales bacterium]|nr:recombinase [Synergistales bacterium]